IDAGNEAALTAAFAAAGFTAYVLSTRSDGRLDLELYGIGGAFPDAVVAALAVLGLEPSERRQASERELLANVLDGEPCELCPGVWIDPQGTMATTAEQLILHIPPSPAFGDGHHPSTRMAASLLMTMDLRGQRVLDLGCGTGVLGLIAHHRGATAVTFSDIDEGSVRTTRETCALNDYPQAVVLASDLLAAVLTEAVDVVVANLYADLLLLVAEDPRLQRILPHGTLIVSGVAQTKRAHVEAAFAARGFSVQDERSEAWWNALRLTR
ncbi:MAG TPA: 50S ribosomal protein L11 methyltransferase, partial [Planctomycetota bacterium]|nr:50S ribosomal protein L11 methyltransferase [Planctomycetota bacterium]